MARPEKIEFALVSVFIGLLVLGLALVLLGKTIRGEFERADVRKFEGMRPPTAGLPIFILSLRGKAKYRPRGSTDWFELTERSALAEGVEIEGSVTLAIGDEGVLSLDEGVATLHELSMEADSPRILIEVHSGSLTIATTDEESEVEVVTADATYATGSAVFKVTVREGRSQAQVLYGTVRMMTKDGRVWEIRAGNVASVMQEGFDEQGRPVGAMVDVRAASGEERRGLVSFVSRSSAVLEKPIEAVSAREGARERTEAEQVAEVEDMVEFCRAQFTEKRIEKVIHYAADPFTFQDEVLTHDEIIEKFHFYADRFSPLEFFVDEEGLRVDLEPEANGAMLVIKGRAIGIEVGTGVEKEKRGMLYIWLERGEKHWVAQWAIFEDAMKKGWAGGSEAIE